MPSSSANDLTAALMVMLIDDCLIAPQIADCAVDIYLPKRINRLTLVLMPKRSNASPSQVVKRDIAK